MRVVYLNRDCLVVNTFGPLSRRKRSRLMKSVKSNPVVHDSDCRTWDVVFCGRTKMGSGRFGIEIGMVPTRQNANPAPHSTE